MVERRHLTVSYLSVILIAVGIVVSGLSFGYLIHHNLQVDIENRAADDAKRASDNRTELLGEISRLRIVVAEYQQKIADYTTAYVKGLSDLAKEDNDKRDQLRQEFTLALEKKADLATFGAMSEAINRMSDRINEYNKSVSERMSEYNKLLMEHVQQNSRSSD